MRGRWLARSATVLTPAGRRSLATRGLRWLSGRIPPDLVDSFVLAQDIVDPAEGPGLFRRIRHSGTDPSGSPGSRHPRERAPAVIPR